MGHRLRRCQDDDGSAGPADPPLSHPRNRKRQLPIQGQLGCSRTEERRKGQSLDQSLIRKPYSEVAHFSVEKPAQFRVETNTESTAAGALFQTEGQPSLSLPLEVTRAQLGRKSVVK